MIRHYVADSRDVQKVQAGIMRAGSHLVSSPFVLVLLAILVSGSVPTWESFLLHVGRPTYTGPERTLYIRPVSGLAGRLRTVGEASQAPFKPVTSSEEEWMRRAEH